MKLNGNESTICPAFYAAIKPAISPLTAIDGWYKDGIQIDFETNEKFSFHEIEGSLIFRSPEKSEEGVYYVKASNKLGVVESNRMTVKVKRKHFVFAMGNHNYVKDGGM